MAEDSLDRDNMAHAQTESLGYFVAEFTSFYRGAWDYNLTSDLAGKP